MYNGSLEKKWKFCDIRQKDRGVREQNHILTKKKILLQELRRMVGEKI